MHRRRQSSSRRPGKNWVLTESRSTRQGKRRRSLRRRMLLPPPRRLRLHLHRTLLRPRLLRIRHRPRLRRLVPRRRPRPRQRRIRRRLLHRMRHLRPRRRRTRSPRSAIRHRPRPHLRRRHLVHRLRLPAHRPSVSMSEWLRAKRRRQVPGLRACLRSVSTKGWRRARRRPLEEDLLLNLRPRRLRSHRKPRLRLRRPMQPGPRWLPPILKWLLRTMPRPPSRMSPLRHRDKADDDQEMDKAREQGLLPVGRRSPIRRLRPSPRRCRQRRRLLRA